MSIVTKTQDLSENLRIAEAMLREARWRAKSDTLAARCDEQRRIIQECEARISQYQLEYAQAPSDIISLEREVESRKAAFASHVNGGSIERLITLTERMETLKRAILARGGTPLEVIYRQPASNPVSPEPTA